MNNIRDRSNETFPFEQVINQNTNSFGKVLIMQDRIPNDTTVLVKYGDTMYEGKVIIIVIVIILRFSHTKLMNKHHNCNILFTSWDGLQSGMSGSHLTMFPS